MSEAVFDLAEIFDALPYPVFAKDSRHRWIYGNLAFAQLVGLDDFVGLDDRAAFDQAQVDVFWREDQRVMDGEESLNEEQIGDGTFALTKKVPLHFKDGTTGLVGIVIDSIKIQPQSNPDVPDSSLTVFADARATSMQKRLAQAVAEKEQAVQVAHTDPATGLRNRRGFEADLKRVVECAEDTGRPFGVAMVDMDHFKRINDRFGHATGDLVLKEIGRRLRRLPHILSAARMGGDEFAVISEYVNPDRHAGLEKLREYVFRPVYVLDREIELSGSAGSCLFKHDADTPADLLACADFALLTAKRNGRGRSQIFDESVHRAAKRRTHIEDKLPHAIRHGLITPHYQPILCSTTRRAIGVEVLARWKDDKLGAVGPDEFVGVASDIGLVSDLDRSVLKTALRDARDWLERGLIEFVSLNASPIDIVSPGYATDLLKRIRAAGVAPDRVSLEILESSIVADVAAARRNLDRLREAGVTIALDDYGTGFSNLRALLDMPLDKLKIDKSLVAGIETSDAVLDLLISIVQFGRSLNLTLVAEGIETAAQSAFIEGAGAPQMQGYFFARPMPAEAAAEWLDRQMETDAGETPVALDRTG